MKAESPIPLELTAVPRVSLKRVRSIGSACVILMLSYGWVWASSSISVIDSGKDEGEPSEITQRESTDRQPKVETLTMSISLEEGGAIDLDPPPRDMTVQTWKGDDVLVIVEKVQHPRQKGEQRAQAEPIDIQVTRKGKDVLIETRGGANWNESGMDLSFRIMLPDRYRLKPGTTEKTYILSGLTSAVWRVLRKEALEWLVK